MVYKEIEQVFNDDHFSSFSFLGCPLPETCMPNLDGDCPAHCPPPCEWATEMVCPGGSDWNGRKRYFSVCRNFIVIKPCFQGCLHPDFCMLSTVPSETTGEECPAHCPATCQQEEQICPGGIDFNGKSSTIVIQVSFKA